MFCRRKQNALRKRLFVFTNCAHDTHLHPRAVVLGYRQCPGMITPRELLKRKLFLWNLLLHHLFACSIFMTETNKRIHCFCQGSSNYEKKQRGLFFHGFNDDAANLHSRVSVIHCLQNDLKFDLKTLRWGLRTPSLGFSRICRWFLAQVPH